MLRSIYFAASIRTAVRSARRAAPPPPRPRRAFPALSHSSCSALMNAYSHTPSGGVAGGDLRQFRRISRHVGHQSPGLGPICPFLRKNPGGLGLRMRIFCPPMARSELAPRIALPKALSMTSISHDRLLIIDFGSQVTQLIARRLREIERLLRNPSLSERDRRFPGRFRPKGGDLLGWPRQRCP